MVDAAARSGQTQSAESSGESGELKEAFRLALRCWPYYRAQAKHLATFVLIKTASTKRVRCSTMQHRG